MFAARNMMLARSGNAPAEGLDPDVLALSPVLWLTNTGADAGVWSDVTGHGNDWLQATVADQPAIISAGLNGLQIRRWDGTSDWMSWAAVNIRTVLFVYQRGGGNVSYAALFGHDTLYGQFFKGTSPTNAWLASNSLAPWLTSTWKRDDTVIDPQAAESDPLGWSVMSIETPSDIAPNQTMDRNFLTRVPKMDLAEMIMFDYVLTELNRAAVQQYLGVKWGLYMDPGAAAYIAAVEAALGSSITETQKSAIDAFTKAEKLGGRWTSHKRLYLPIWANAAANAICLKSLTSGTFAGTVTHGAGFVQGNGSTGYFDFNATIASIGANLNNHTLLALRLTSDNRSGSRQTVTTSGGKSQIAEYSGSNLYRISGGSQSYLGGPGSCGILVASRTTSTQQRLTLRKTSGLSQFSAEVTSASLLSGDGHYYGAIPGFDYSSAQIGAAGCGLGLTASQCDAFTLNLKTLWETCTGLTLP